MANARSPGHAKFANAPPSGLTRRANAPQLPGASRAHLELTDSLIVVTRFCKTNLTCFNGRALLNVLALGKVNIQTSYSVLKTVLTQLRYLLIRHDSHSLMSDSNKNINSQLFDTAAVSWRYLTLLFFESDVCFFLVWFSVRFLSFLLLCLSSSYFFFCRAIFISWNEDTSEGHRRIVTGRTVPCKAPTSCRQQVNFWRLVTSSFKPAD